MLWESNGIIHVANMEDCHAYWTLTCQSKLQGNWWENWWGRNIQSQPVKLQEVQFFMLKLNNIERFLAQDWHNLLWLRKISKHFLGKKLCAQAEIAKWGIPVLLGGVFFSSCWHDGMPGRVPILLVKTFHILEILTIYPFQGWRGLPTLFHSPGLGINNT